MSPQATRVLAYLRDYGRNTDSTIARALDIPEPSVRRSIQQLIREGQPISHAGSDGCYVYLANNQPAGVSPELGSWSGR